MKSFLIITLTLLSLQTFAASPNIILILSDDQGWNNTSTLMHPSRPDSKSDYYLTPNIERLAKRGMTFSQAYAPHAVCSPSRHSIQFGVTPGKLNKPTNAGEKYANPFDTPSIPQTLKAINPNYATAHFGKWHMYSTPSKLAYDQSHGPTNNKTGHHSTTDQSQFWPADDPKLINTITNDSIAFIKQQAASATPFYLQISHYAIHLNAEATQATLDKHKPRTPGKVHSHHWYAAMLDDFDASIGRILNTLDQLNLTNNTYIFYTSDNGGTARQYPDLNKPLRAGKGSFYEGGLRVPFIATGPNIPPASFSSIPVIGYDLLPTFATIAGGSKASLSEHVEGGSILNTLQNPIAPVTRPRHGLFFFKKFEKVIAIGPYKLKLNTPGPIQSKTTQPSTELFNLKTDLSEQNNLADKNPEIVASLTKQYYDWITEAKVASKPGAAPPPLPASLQPKPAQNAGGNANRKPSGPAKPGTYTLKANQTLQSNQAPKVHNLALNITVTINPTSPKGVIVAQGGTLNGYALHLKNAHPTLALRFNETLYEVSTPNPIPLNASTSITANIATDGTLTISINNQPSTKATSPGPIKSHPISNLTTSQDTPSAVGDYQRPNKFQGQITNLKLTTSN